MRRSVLLFLFALVFSPVLAEAQLPNFNNSGSQQDSPQGFGGPTGPGGPGGGPGGGSEELIVHLEFLGGDGEWHDEISVCQVVSNHDFTELQLGSNSEGDPLIKDLWNDLGIPPTGADHAQKLEDLSPEPWLRYLEILGSDERLTSMRIWVESANHPDDVELRFDVINLNLVVYNDLGTGRTRSLAPTQPGEKATIPTSPMGATENERNYTFFLIEGHYGSEQALDPLADHPNMMEQIGPIFAFCKPVNAAQSEEESDFIQTESVIVDSIIEPDNWNETDQKYVNEYVEANPDMGAWIRVNDDFSKELHDSSDEYLRDNKRLSGSYEFDMTDSALVPVRLICGARPGIVTIEIPSNVVLWEVNRQDHSDVVCRESNFQTTPKQIDTQMYFLEAIKRSESKATDKLVIRYKAEGKAIVGKNSNAEEQADEEETHHDFSLFTAAELQAHVDGDRNAKFDVNSIRDKFLLFWSNEDDDKEIKIVSNGPKVEVDKGDRREEDAADSPVDSADLIIDQQRDLEDFAQFYLHTDPLVISEHESETARTHLLDPTANHFGISSSGNIFANPNFHVFGWRDNVESARDHVLDKNAYNGRYKNLRGYELFRERMTPLADPWNASQQTAFDGDYDGEGYKTEVYDYGVDKRFLFEAKNAINTFLQAKVFIEYSTKTKYSLIDETRTRIEPIADFYDTHKILNAEKSTAKLFCWAEEKESEKATVHDLSGHGAKFFKLPDEQYTFCVHGWNNNETDKRLLVETFAKRMYWQGYQGRIGLFSWPTLVSAGGVTEATEQTYNPSEYNGFRSGMALMNSIAIKVTDDRYDRDDVHVFAHSMGNVVAIEAQRLWAYGPNVAEGVWNTKGNPWCKLLGAASASWDDDAETLWYQDNGQLFGTYISANAAFSRGAFGSDDDGVLSGTAVAYLNHLNEIDPTDYFFPLSGLLAKTQDRWKMISKGSDFYRYFAAGVPKQGGDGTIPDWEQLEQYVFGTVNQFQDREYRGEAYYMKGTELVAKKLVNSYSTNDYALKAPWQTNMAIKGLFPVHGSWDSAYTSDLSTLGRWKFYRKPKPNFVKYRFKEVFDLATGSKFSDLTDYLGSIGVEASALLGVLTPGGQPMPLGTSREFNEVPRLDVDAYEVMAFLSRSNSLPIGLAPMSSGPLKPSKITFIDEEQIENNSFQPGGDSTPSHSFFYYHNAAMNKGIYLMVVDRIKESSLIKSTYK